MVRQEIEPPHQDIWVNRMENQLNQLEVTHVHFPRALEMVKTVLTRPHAIHDDQMVNPGFSKVNQQPLATVYADISSDVQRPNLIPVTIPIDYRQLAAFYDPQGVQLHEGKEQAHTQVGIQLRNLLPDSRRGLDDIHNNLAIALEALQSSKLSAGTVFNRSEPLKNNLDRISRVWIRTLYMNMQDSWKQRGRIQSDRFASLSVYQTYQGHIMLRTQAGEQKPNEHTHPYHRGEYDQLQNLLNGVGERINNAIPGMRGRPYRP